MLAGGVRCVSGEQVRPRQRRKDADTQTAWTMGQHNDSGVWRRFCTRLPNQQDEEHGTRDSILEYSLEC